ncbi:protein kinase protein [Fusarium langsethiae]|uniref:Protein kinase protein n=1 Tax=Fusarium langsethiae TaxID=179993 RepID=A0A0M9ERB5_FUSLA|nr:protein kinase protein [Fusarium langsethiae]
MALRRKVPFCRVRERSPKPTPALYHWNRDPKSDYFPYSSDQPVRGTWIGQHRKSAARQFVTIKELSITKIFDIRQLTSIMHPNIAKPISFYHFGEQLGIMFLIDEIRVEPTGVVKIVLDWNLESNVSEAVKDANEAYLAAHIHHVMEIMAQSSENLPEDGKDFLSCLKLPKAKHPFIYHAAGPAALRQSAAFALQKKTLGS